MTRLSFKTSKKPEEIIDLAEKYFMNEGLKVEEKARCCLRLTGGGGQVEVIITENEKTEVELTGREWDYQIKQFVEKTK